MTERRPRATGRRVTLEDVARHAEVSRALVSIVMRDVPGASAATRERVLAAAAELGYRPDVRARSLAGQTSRLIGVMFGVGVGSFHFDLLEGLYAAAETRGLNVILTAVTRGRGERAAAESLQDFRFDGLIMLGPPTAVPLLAGRVPVVVVGWHVEDPSVDVVRISDQEGMSAAIEHLVGLGHRRIAHLDGGNTLIATARREAYRAAMAAAGLEAEVQVVPAGPSQIDGQRAARRLLQEPELPTALIAYNDDAAVAAMGLLAQQGVRIPDQISIVGWDDSATAALSPVSLTTVAQDPRLIAEYAVERMAARSAGSPVEDREIVLSPRLQIRASTAAPRSR